MRHVLTSDLDDELLLGRTLREHVSSIPDIAGGAYVVLDPLCPLVPVDFVADLVARVVDTGVAHVGVRPVTDTVKVMHDGLVGGTVDRAALVQLAAPVVLPEPVEVAGTLAELVATLDEVVLVEAPALARRIGDRSDLELLAALAQSL
ncbi:MAG TPA: 2-C-methyl-D-erythritol 4-phosphate cytidylyltransferase [Nocardioidaceae bacterium]|nr:2-C-methyl-D-erythritol 4-phosphate cytidylyltransferase [Nocardioidaceae bacterium]